MKEFPVKVEKHEGKDKMTKEEAFGEVSEVVARWRDEFQEMYLEKNEGFSSAGDAVYAFAEFLREKSTELLKSIREENVYRPEEAAAKFHAFNIAQVEMLMRTAEILEFHPKMVDTLSKTYPWCKDIKEWAESIVGKEGIVTNE